MKHGKKYYIITAIVSVMGVAFFYMIGYKRLSILCAVMFITNVTLCVRVFLKEKKEELHSPAYQHLKNIENSGYARTYEGYTPNQLEGIYDWERDDIEDYIWESFHNREFLDMAPLLPQLKKYDGIAGLKEKYSSFGNRDSAKTIAQVLYEATGDEQYNIIE
ncbi:MAG: hypothetical protein K5770_09040 [Lachnospiraceae bacterium]|nr:hypothetical protein [Lachnospiraceae bacterium]